MQVSCMGPAGSSSVSASARQQQRSARQQQRSARHQQRGRRHQQRGRSRGHRCWQRRRRRRRMLGCRLGQLGCRLGQLERRRRHRRRCCKGRSVVLCSRKQHCAINLACGCHSMQSLHNVVKLAQPLHLWSSKALPGYSSSIRCAAALFVHLAPCYLGLPCPPPHKTKLTFGLVTLPLGQPLGITVTICAACS
jgi:hypothetical protein